MGSIMGDMESVYRAYTRRGHEQLCQDQQQYIHPDYKHDTDDYVSLGYHNATVRAQRILASIEGTGIKVSLDIVLADQSEACLAARWFTEVVAVQPWADHLGVLATGERHWIVEHELVWFRDGKIDKTFSIAEIGELIGDAKQLIAIRSRAPAAPGPEHLDKSEMKEFYTSYIRAINENLSEDALTPFVRRTVIHNSNRLSLPEYVSLINDSSSKFDGMTAHIDTLLAVEKEQLIVAKLEWSGTLKVPLRGAEPNGRSARFSEIVFYQVQSGAIARVWSVVDWDSFASQMRGSVENDI